MKYFPQAIRLLALGLGAFALQSCEYSDNPYGHSSRGSGYYGSAPYYSGDVSVAPVPYNRGDDNDRRYYDNQGYHHDDGDNRYSGDNRYRNDERYSRDDSNRQDNQHRNQTSHPQAVVTTASKPNQRPAPKPSSKPASKPKPNRAPQRPVSKDQPPKGSDQGRGL